MTDRRIPNTPEAALVALAREAVRAITAADAAMGVRHAPYERYEGDALVLLHAEVGAVARLVLSDPAGWAWGLGWGHNWLDWTCTLCGAHALKYTPEICPGVPA